MNANSCFYIGKTHKVCQDYTLAHCEDNKGYAIVSDGCSSSPHTDFGSRILAWAWANVHSELTHFDSIADILTKAKQQVQTLNLPETCLDATLLFARTHYGLYFVRLYGDGVYLKIHKDGTIFATQIEYPSGAPMYLSYSLSDERKQKYIETFGSKTLKKTFILSPSGEMQDYKEQLNSGWSNFEDFGHDGEEYSSLVLLSDGVLSFMKPIISDTSKTLESVSLVEVLQKLLPFKNYKGEFVERRVLAFLKDSDKLGWKHTDDFSMAAIYFGV